MRLRRNRNGGEEPEDNGEGRPPAEEVEIEITGTEVMRVDTPEVPADPIDPLLEQEEDDEAAELAKRASKTRVNKTVWIMAIVAVVSLGAGIALSRFVISPAQAAADAEAPEAGPITVEVEERTLSSDVTARGDVVYDDAVSLTIETSDIGGPAVVTGAVPEVGAEVNAGTVLLEVTGRPVIALPGDLPTYRTLRVGVSGPDVEQLQAALGEMGFDAGASGTYDAATANAVAALFAQAGYPAPEPPEGTEEALEGAQEAVNSAQQSLDQANSSLQQAQSGPSQSERIAAQNGVNSAQRALNDAKECANAPDQVDPETGATIPNSCPSVADAQDNLNLAIAQRDEALAGQDTSDLVASRDAAQRSLNDAQEQLAEARNDVLTPLPASEVAYLANMPRRVDSVAVERGTQITGAVMTISGATLEVVANVSDANAELLQVGMAATMTSGDMEIPATIAEINAESTANNDDPNSSSSSSSSSSDRTEVILHPVEITEEQRSAIIGTNIRITIPVESTGGDVLAVPVAALTAGPGGETRVEVMRDGEEQPELVVVTTGLSAEGYAEITSSEAPLAAGDLVVVGQSDGETEDESEEES